MIGIYQIQNRINGKRYVGMSGNVKRRWMEHKCPSRVKPFSSVSLAIKKYGSENFDFSILEICSFEIMPYREIYWIEKLNPEYNRNFGGRGNARHCSESTKSILRKYGKAQWDRKTELEKWAFSRKNLCGPKTPYRVSEETKEKIRLVKTGSKLSEEIKAKISASNRKANVGNIKRNKPVELVSENPNSCCVYASINIAAEMLGIYQKTIHGSLKRNGPCRAGRTWRLFSTNCLQTS